MIGVVLIVVMIFALFALVPASGPSYSTGPTREDLMGRGTGGSSKFGCPMGGFGCFLVALLFLVLAPLAPGILAFAFCATAGMIDSCQH